MLDVRGYGTNVCQRRSISPNSQKPPVHLYELITADGMDEDAENVKREVYWQQNEQAFDVRQVGQS